MAWRRDTTITRAEWDALGDNGEGPDRPITDDPIRLRSPDRPGWTPRQSLLDQYLAREEGTA